MAWDFCFNSIQSRYLISALPVERLWPSNDLSVRYWPKGAFGAAGIGQERKFNVYETRDDSLIVPPSCFKLR